jgi:hypothetical protein
MTEPEMKWVDSSNVESIGYDEESKDLYVRFRSGSPMYIYEGVPQASFDELMNSDSIGSYLNQQIKPNYHFRTL